jgi:hypothetical protein
MKFPPAISSDLHFVSDIVEVSIRSFRGSS